MLSVGNLGIHPIRLAPGEEKRFAGDGYYFLMLRQGQAYWLQGDANAILEPGSLLVVPRSSVGCLRGGRFDESSLVGFVVCLYWLEGLLTVREKMSLESWFGTLKFPHTMPSDHAAVEFLARVDLLNALEDPNDLPARIKSLEVLALLLKEIENGRGEASNSGAFASCESRMRQFFDVLTVLELRALSLDRVAESCGCSPRHAGRVFRRCFGASFRSKQIDIRMEKAAALLAEGKLPVESVAETCGFDDGQSLRNAFRRRFGFSPREWAQSQASPSATWE